MTHLSLLKVVELTTKQSIIDQGFHYQIEHNYGYLSTRGTYRKIGSVNVKKRIFSESEQEKYPYHLKMEDFLLF